MKKLSILLLLFTNIALAENSFQEKINIEKRFINGFICSDQEFKKLKKENPELFKKTHKNRSKNCPFVSIDKLNIRKIKDGKIKINMETSFYNGHQCSLIDEIFSPSGEGFILSRNEFNSKNRKDMCTINVFIDSKKVRFSVLNREFETGCRVFCGARGSIDGTIFERKD